MGGVQLSQGHRATTRDSLLFTSSPQECIYSLKAESTWELPNGLNPELLDYESSATAIEHCLISKIMYHLYGICDEYNL